MKTGTHFAMALAIASTLTTGAIAGDLLIPVENRRDHIYNEADGILYITTGDGQVQRWDVAGQELLSPFAGVGNSLRAIDITPDGSTAYIAEGQRDISQGYIRKVDLASGMTTSLTYAPVGMPAEELGAWDLSIGDNGRAFFTVEENAFVNLSWPVREIDLSTDMISIRSLSVGSGGSTVQPLTNIVRSADRSMMYFSETDTPVGPVFTYQTAIDSFDNSYVTHENLLNKASAVSRDGSLIAQGAGPDIQIYDSDLMLVTTLDDVDGGMVFSPTSDRMYAASSATSEVVVYETSGFTEVDRFSAGETLSSSLAFSDGVMSMSSDGNWLFLSTGSGIRAYNVPAPGAISLGLIGAMAGVGRRRR